MKIPKKLKVGGITYAVEKTRTVDEKKERQNWGKTNYGLAKIYIDKELSGDVLEETFLHELIHTVFNLTGIDAEVKDKNEEYVDRLAKAFYTVLKDNKLLR